MIKTTKNPKKKDTRKAVLIPQHRKKDLKLLNLNLKFNKITPSEWSRLNIPFLDAPLLKDLRKGARAGKIKPKSGSEKKKQKYMKQTHHRKLAN